MKVAAMVPDPGISLRGLKILQKTTGAWFVYDPTAPIGKGQMGPDFSTCPAAVAELERQALKQPWRARPGDLSDGSKPHL